MAMTPRNTRQYWVNTFWADISAQLRRLSVVEPSLYDGLQLKRDGALGHWLVEELRLKYDVFSRDRNWITVIVCPLHEGPKIDWKLEWWLRRPGGVVAGSIQTYSTIKPLIESNISSDASSISHAMGSSKIPPYTTQGLKRVFGPGNSKYDYWDWDGEVSHAVSGEIEGNFLGNGKSNAEVTTLYPAAAARSEQHTYPKRKCCEGKDDGAETQEAAKKINVKGRRQ